MNTTNKLLCSFSVLLAALVPARAGAPEYINYQGLLNDPGGQPLATGSYVMEFNIYDAPTGGTNVWGPFLFDGGTGAGHDPLVPVANGRFNVIIGPRDTSSNPIQQAFDGTDRFIEITVGTNGTPILPRQQFLSTPYAFRADRAVAVAAPGQPPSIDLVGGKVRFSSDVTGELRIVADGNGLTHSSVNGGTVLKTWVEANRAEIGTTTADALHLTANNGGARASLASDNTFAVNGDIKLGPTAQYQASAAVEKLRIVRGTVAADGTIIEGSGFESTRPELTTGVYTITFPVGTFTLAPTVVASSSGTAVVAAPSGVTTDSCTITQHTPTVGNQNIAFSFIAIGLR